MASAKDRDFVDRLGADVFVDFRSQKFEDVAQNVDGVLDMVGGGVRERSMKVLKPEGIMVTVASPVPDEMKRSMASGCCFFWWKLRRRGWRN